MENAVALVGVHPRWTRLIVNHSMDSVIDILTNNDGLSNDIEYLFVRLPFKGCELENRYGPGCIWFCKRGRRFNKFEAYEVVGYERYPHERYQSSVIRQSVSIPLTFWKDLYLIIFWNLTFKPKSGRLTIPSGIHHFTRLKNRIHFMLHANSSIICDINLDGTINVIDVIVLVNSILN